MVVLKLRINAVNKDTSYTQDPAILPVDTGTSLLFLSTLKCWKVQCSVTKQDTETDYVMKLLSTITGKLLFH